MYSKPFGVGAPGGFSNITNYVEWHIMSIFKIKNSQVVMKLNLMYSNINKERKRGGADMRYCISKYSIYVFLFSLVYLLQRLIFISLLHLPKIEISGSIYIHEILFLFTSFLFVKKSFKINRLD